MSQEEWSLETRTDREHWKEEEEFQEVADGVIKGEGDSVTVILYTVHSLGLQNSQVSY